MIGTRPRQHARLRCSARRRHCCCTEHPPFTSRTLPRAPLSPNALSHDDDDDRDPSPAKSRSHLTARALHDTKAARRRCQAQNLTIPPARARRGGQRGGGNKLRSQQHHHRRRTALARADWPARRQRARSARTTPARAAAKPGTDADRRRPTPADEQRARLAPRSRRRSRPRCPKRWPASPTRARNGMPAQSTRPSRPGQSQLQLLLHATPALEHA